MVRRRRRRLRTQHRCVGNVVDIPIRRACPISLFLGVRVHGDVRARTGREAVRVLLLVERDVGRELYYQYHTV